MSAHGAAMEWPEDRPFAFTVFDDPDGQDLATGREVYAFLRDMGFRTTKGAWPLGRQREVDDRGGDLSDPAYRGWVLELQEAGFEIGWHAASAHTSDRARTLAGLERFREVLGHDPESMSNHYNAEEGIYFGEHRLSGWRRLLYRLAKGRGRPRYWGHVEGHPLFWGDVCRERIRYVRNFVFPGINTLAECPWMPYHDPARPWVRAWYASSEGDQRPRFVERIHEAAQERLEEEGGACIMYTHFGHGFYDGGRIDPRFRQLMERLASRGGWYVPVSELLGYLERRRGLTGLRPADRRALERAWLANKLRAGSS